VARRWLLIGTGEDVIVLAPPSELVQKTIKRVYYSGNETDDDVLRYLSNSSVDVSLVGPKVWSVLRSNARRFATLEDAVSISMMLEGSNYGLRVIKEDRSCG
jgi:hypothetical protein